MCLSEPGTSRLCRETVHRSKCCYDESCTARIAKDRYDWQGGRQCVAMTGKRVRMLNLRRVVSDVAAPGWGLRKNRSVRREDSASF